MNYKKDMLLIIIAVFMLGAAIQAVRTDFVSNISSNVRLVVESGNINAASYERGNMGDGDTGIGHTLFHALYNRLRAQ